MARPRNASAEILDAARRIVARDGGGRLTMDALAAEVGMSKGGVLYNFPSKLALLEALLAEMVAVFEENLAAARSAVGAQPNATLRAVLATYAVMEAPDCEVSAAILAAAAEAPALLDPVRALLGRLQADVQAEAAEPTLALAVLAALDGLRFQRLMRLPPDDPALRAAILARLGTLVDAMEPRR